MQNLVLPVICAGLSFSQMSFGQLQGVIDIHTHRDPDIIPRSIDVLDFAKQAKAEGMRAIVLKNHYAPTVRVAYLVGPTRRSFLGLN